MPPRGWRNQGQTCRACGCTDDDCTKCYLRTGTPCFWAQDSLCSTCAHEVETRVTLPLIDTLVTEALSLT